MAAPSPLPLLRRSRSHCRLSRSNSISLTVHKYCLCCCRSAPHLRCATLRVCRLATAGCCCAALLASFSVVLLCAAPRLGRAASASGTSLELHALPARIREQHFVRVGRSRTLRLKAFAFSLSVPCLPLWLLCFSSALNYIFYTFFFPFLFLTRNLARFVCSFLCVHLPKNA